jgi:hypothetical protein
LPRGTVSNITLGGRKSLGCANAPRASLSRSPAASLDALEAARGEAWRRWAALFSEPDCLTNPAKRHAMTRARLEYQQASLLLFEARHGHVAAQTPWEPIGGDGARGRATPPPRSVV